MGDEKNHYFQREHAIPLGLSESGDWFLATSREQLTTLGLYACWMDEVGIVHHVYLLSVSTAKEHSALCAIACSRKTCVKLHFERFDDICCFKVCAAVHIFFAMKFACWLQALPNR